MYINNCQFRVNFTPFSERHYCKDYYKKYSPKQWSETKKTITDLLIRAHAVQSTNLLDIISYNKEHEIAIVKLDFRVAGTNESPKTSGNRVVGIVHNTKQSIEVIMVYGKIHCPKSQSETQWIFEIIKEHFSEYKGICTLQK